VSIRSTGIIALIPARGGSQRIIDKNIRPIAGVPLVLRAAQTAGEVADRVVVSTDSDEVVAVCEPWGIEVDRSFAHSDETSVDGMVAHYRAMWPDSTLLVVQPTVPEVMASDLRGMLDRVVVEPSEGVTAAHEGYHITWHDDSSGSSRHLADRGHSEIGVRCYPPGEDTLGVYLPMGPFIDIDVPSDLTAARQRIEAKRVLFRVRYDTGHGSGHLRRCLALAGELQHYGIAFTATTDTLFPDDFPFHNLDVDRVSWKPDVIVNDTLDTTRAEMLALAAVAPVVTLEDLGPGARHADKTINALYGSGEYSGPKWADLRPEFAHLPPKDYSTSGRVLVTFGGTDPAGLTSKFGDVLRAALAHVVVADGISNMAAEMHRADAIVCSAGRTVFEAARVGTPAVVVAQNVRETSHTHLGLEHGNIPLGLGELLDPADLVAAVRRLMDQPGVRQAMGERAQSQVDGLGLRRMVRVIEDIAEGL
jgi:spore coat polysaccharide biosynthesis predicted glycosyltransferase SpsG/molybdopterin-guanine dinucleotide biosynthesis protein A